MATEQDADGGAEHGKKASTAHLISIEKLIVHKYSDPKILLGKADKVAREIINEDMREGEYLQTLQPGRYFLHCPKLTPDAGALRVAVLTEKLYRAIRDLNPAAQKLDSAPSKAAPEPPPRAAAPAAPSRPAPAAASAPAAADPTDKRTAEMRKASNAALSAMAGKGTLTREELLAAPLGQQLQESLTIELMPMWYVAERVLIGHDCIPYYEGAPLRTTGRHFADVNPSPDEIRATIDTLVYERAVAELRKNQREGAVGLLTCPVHASTLTSPKFIGAYLSAGADLPSESRKYFLFVVKEFTTPPSRIKIREAAGYLKPRARALIVDLPLNTGSIVPDFKEFGFYATRATLTGTSYSEATIHKLMDEFAERSEKAKLRSTIDGLETTSQTVAAVAAGYSYLSGPAIQRQADTNAKVQDFDVDTLFV
jgi:hypothetical protein